MALFPARDPEARPGGLPWSLAGAGALLGAGLEASGRLGPGGGALGGALREALPALVAGGLELGAAAAGGAWLAGRWGGTRAAAILGGLLWAWASAGLQGAGAPWGWALLPVAIGLPARAAPSEGEALGLGAGVAGGLLAVESGPLGGAWLVAILLTMGEVARAGDRRALGLLLQTLALAAVVSLPAWALRLGASWPTAGEGPLTSWPLLAAGLLGGLRSVGSSLRARLPAGLLAVALLPAPWGLAMRQGAAGVGLLILAGALGGGDPPMRPPRA